MSLLNGDEYIALLLRRQQEWMDKHATGPQMRFPPLLEWFIRPGDEDLVDPAVLAPPEPSPAQPRQARTYRSAESLRGERDRVQAQLDAIHGRDGGDRAAANLSPQSRSRAARTAGRRRFARLDRDLERHTQLTARLRRLNARLAAAEAREARGADGATR